MAVPLLRSTIAQKCLILAFFYSSVFSLMIGTLSAGAETLYEALCLGEPPKYRQDENPQLGGVGFQWQPASSSSSAMGLIFTMQDKIY